MQLQMNSRYARFSLYISFIAFGFMYILASATSTAEETADKSPIVHLPIPVAPKGQAFPILAGVRDSAGKVQSMTVKIKGTDVKTANLTMISLGKENQYEAVIPAESMTASALFYSIELVSDNGTFSTPWYPVKTASIQDEVQKTVENQSEPVSKTAKAKTWVKSHPYITAGAAVGTVAVGAAVAGGGGGGGGGDSSGSTSNTGDGTGTADTSALQGSVSGSWSGVVMGSINASGTFSITISDHGTISGSYSGTQSGSISGTITSAGAMTASGSAGNAVWNGQVNGQSGSLTASGTWTGYDGGGTWSGSGG